MRINMVSESEISVRGHGVHTAYIELVKVLSDQPGFDVIKNHFLSHVKADITHIHTVGLPSLAKLLWGDGKKVVSAHIVPDSLVGSIALAKYWLPVAKVYLGFFYRKADKVVAVSQYTANNLQKELGVDSSKIEIIDNTIDTTYYRSDDTKRSKARLALGFKEQDFIVIGNGQVQPRKRFDVFVDVARQLPDVKFVWVGGIPFKHAASDYKKMQELIKNAPDNVKVTGVVELSAVRLYLQAGDALLFPSMQETFGLAIVEAAAAGLPVVVRDISDYDKTFGDNVIRCKTDGDFVSSIKKLKNDDEFYKDYKAKSLTIAKKFDSRQGVKRVVAMYEELVRAKA